MNQIEYYLNNPTVLVTPKDGDDFTHEFVGDVVGSRNGYLTVRDGDDNHVEVDLDQVKPYPEEDQETEDEAIRREMGLGPWPEPQ